MSFRSSRPCSTCGGARVLDEEEDGGLATGVAILLGVVGGAVVCAALGGIVLFATRNNRRQPAATAPTELAVVADSYSHPSVVEGTVASEQIPVARVAFPVAYVATPDEVETPKAADYKPSDDLAAAADDGSTSSAVDESGAGRLRDIDDM